jgi:hypothetical protein
MHHWLTSRQIFTHCPRPYVTRSAIFTSSIRIGKGCAADRYCPKETCDEYESRHGDPPEDVIAAHFCEELRYNEQQAKQTSLQAYANERVF